MRKRPRLYLAGMLTGAVLLLALLSPRGRWAVWGWLRGEAFYHGRPTSYWRSRLADWNDLVFYPPASPLIVRCRPPRPDGARGCGPGFPAAVATPRTPRSRFPPPCPSSSSSCGTQTRTLALTRPTP
jgi:hypothetical protein